MKCHEDPKKVASLGCDCPFPGILIWPKDDNRWNFKTSIIKLKIKD
jgi:hypothetical protein